MNIEPIPATANLQRQSPSEEFWAIDQFVRMHVRGWATVAQQCLRVKQAELWRHDPQYHSWNDWLAKVSPDSKCLRTLYYHCGLVEDLSQDFTADELGHLRVEAAKTLRKVSKAVRHDPAVRNAATVSKRALLDVLRDSHPLQHIENDLPVFFEQSDFDEIEE